MFCPYCGNTIDKLTRHCPSCGASLEDEKESMEPSPAKNVGMKTSTGAYRSKQPAQATTTNTAGTQATAASNSQTPDEPKKKKSLPKILLTVVLSTFIGSAMAQSCARRTIEASRVNSSSTSRTSTHTSEANDTDVKEEEPEEKAKEESEQAAQDAETTTTATEDDGKTTESKSSDDTEPDPADARQITHDDIDIENARQLDFREMMIASGYDNEYEFEGLVLHMTPLWFEYGRNDDGTQMTYKTFTDDCHLAVRTIENQGATPEDLVTILNMLLEEIESQNEKFEIVEEPHSIDASEDGYQAAQMLLKTTKSDGIHAPTTHLIEQILTDDGRIYAIEATCFTSDEDQYLDKLKTILSILEVKQPEQ